MPFPQNQKVLTLICMNPPDTILVSNLPENTPEFAIQIYFEKFAPVAHVKFVSPTQALLTFKSHEGKKVDYMLSFQTSENKDVVFVFCVSSTIIFYNSTLANSPSLLL